MQKENFIYLLGLIILTRLFTSCQNEAQWYPDAEVTLHGYAEYASSTGDGVLVTLVVRNTSSARISSGAVTLKVLTDKRGYLQTAGLETRINPGGKVAVTVSVPFLEPGERVTQDGISVYNRFFD